MTALTPLRLYGSLSISLIVWQYSFYSSILVPVLFTNRVQIQMKQSCVLFQTSLTIENVVTNQAMIDAT